MQLGIGSYTFPWRIGFEEHKNPQLFRDVLDLLENAHAAEIGIVQICDNLPLAALSNEQLETLIKTARSRNILIQPGSRRLSLTNLRKHIVLAEKFGSPFFRMVIDDQDYHPSESQVVDVISEILPELEAYKVMLAIENHDRFPADSLKRIIENTDKELVGVCLDTANSLGAGEGIAEIIDVLAPFTVNLHIKDIAIERFAHKMGFTVSGTAAGEGQLDIPGIVKTINEQSPRCESCILEIWSGPLASKEENIFRERQWANKSINYLKKILS